MYLKKNAKKACVRQKSDTGTENAFNFQNKRPCGELRPGF